MKKQFQTIRILALAAFATCAMGFAACDDDDNPSTDTVTVGMIKGTYSGTMETAYVSTHALLDGDDSQETPQGVHVSATIDDDSICFEDFPIKDIALSITQDETTAEQIVEAVGQVDYKVGYTGALNAEKDSIFFDTTPKPLTLTVRMPSATEGEETQPLTVTVSVEPVKGGAFAVDKQRVKFSLRVSKITIGEGESQTELEGFNGMTLNFDMGKIWTE